MYVGCNCLNDRAHKSQSVIPNHSVYKKMDISALVCETPPLSLVAEHLGVLKQGGMRVYLLIKQRDTHRMIAMLKITD